MYSLMGDRFLKQFFGSRLHRRKVNPASEAMTLPANETDKPDEPGDTTRGNPQATGDVAGAGNGAPAAFRSYRASPRPYQAGADVTWR